jgi:hypothetical protein
MFTGKCSRCEVLKAEFEEIPKLTDLLLCNLCHGDVSRRALTDHKLEGIIEALRECSRKYPRITATVDMELIINDLIEIINQPNY